MTELSLTDSIWLRIGYSRSRGQSFRTLGTRNGTAGSGRIEGQIFFDENRDFVRQPSEPAAVGVTVLLDGQYETRTDGQGRYAFDPVVSGSHTIQVLVEELPLPWSLDDETPKVINVVPRQPVYSDFALVQIN